MTQTARGPLVSVCIPSYNCEKYIGEAIQSVIDQSWANWELIITDDASSDGSVAIAREYAKTHPDKIKVHVSETNRGPAGNFNWMCSLAKGEYIAILGTDDRMTPRRLERQLRRLEDNTALGAVCSEINLIDGDGRPIHEASVFDKPITNLRAQLLDGNFLNQPSFMIRKSVWDRVGQFSPDLLYLHDYDHHLRILDHYDIERMPEKLTDYRVHGDNLSVANPGEQAYAPAYETVVVLNRTIRRWFTEKLFFTRALQRIESPTPAQQAETWLFFAHKLIRADEGYLGQFQFSVSLVYDLLLAVLEIDPANPEARELLSQVYRALGDIPRSEGDKSVLMKERLKQLRSSRSNTSDPENLTVMERLVRSWKTLGGSLAQRATELASKSGDAVDADRFKIQLFIEVAEYLLETLSGNGLSFARGREEIEAFLSASAGLKGSTESRDALLRIRQKLRAKQQELYYKRWRQVYGLREIDGQLFAERMMLKWRRQPVFHCILFLTPGEERLLADTLDSLAAQMYGNWRLSVIAETPAPDALWEEMDALHWIQFDGESNPYTLVNDLVDSVAADWIAFIEPGVQFEPQAFVQMGDYANLYETWRLIYSDHDIVNPDGAFTAGVFKPDINPDLLRANPYIGTCFVNRQALINVGGYCAYPGFENHDISLKIMERYGDAAIGHIADVLLHCPDESSPRRDAKILRQVVQHHLDRSGVAAVARPGFSTETVRIEYLYEEQVPVSIVIPNKDKFEYLRQCLESLLTKTAWEEYEIVVVDNESSDPDVLSLYQRYENDSAVEFRVVPCPGTFNFSAMCNLGIEKSRFDHVLLLNNDTEIVQAYWLERMVQHIRRPEIGAVGARLAHPETGTLQHAGFVLGLGGIVGSAYGGAFELQEADPMERSLCDQNYSAVSGACMLLDKRKVEKVGGMDEVNYPVFFGDVDLCLRLRSEGYRTVWTPFATVVHYEGASMKGKSIERMLNHGGALRRSAHAILAHHLSDLAGDPAWNPNLSLKTDGALPEIFTPCNWDTHFHDRLRVLGFPLPGGSGDYRIIQPFDALSDAGLQQCEYYRHEEDGNRQTSIIEIARMQPDTLVVQAAVDDLQIDLIKDIHEHLPDVFRVFTLDDLITDIPEKSSVYKMHKSHFRDVRSRLRKVLGYCDRLIVTTEPLAEACADFVEDIQVIPNRLQGEKWLNLESARQTSDKPRVGWVGAAQHHGDLEIIFEVVRKTADEVDWIFMGMCPDEIKPYVKEFHPFVAIDQYPAKMASLNLDLAVAPLLENNFNRAKSNLRLLEYGVLGWPVICTDIEPYRAYNAPVTRIPNDPGEWIAAIRTHLRHPEENAAAGDRLRQWVLRHFILEDHLDEWQRAFSREQIAPSLAKAG